MVTQPHEDLVAWQRAMDLTIAVYAAVKRFPPDERFALADQIRRAAVSIPANIAEGNGRDSERSSLQFCLIAHGSLREVETHIQIANRLGYIDAALANELRKSCDAVGRPLRGLIAYLRKGVAGHTLREDETTTYDADL